MNIYLHSTYGNFLCHHTFVHKPEIYWLLLKDRALIVICTAIMNCERHLWQHAPVIRILSNWRVNEKLEFCLLATSVGPLLYSLQDLPFHLAECAHTLTLTQTHTCSHCGRTHANIPMAGTGDCSYVSTKRRADDGCILQPHTYFLFFSFHLSYWCLFSSVLLP